MAKNVNTTSIGFEEIIWRAADKLRGNLSASEYEETGVELEETEVIWQRKNQAMYTY